MSLIDKLKRLKIHPYYYVPKCPVCGSQMTGRYIKDHRANDINYIIDDALRHGELVKPLPELPKYKNVFCLECESEWYTDIKLMFISSEMREEEKKERKTNEILESRYMENREQERGKKKNPIIGTITGFVGKI